MFSFLFNIKYFPFWFLFATKRYVIWSLNIGDFPNIFILLISNLITLLSNNRFRNNYLNLFKLLRFVAYPKMVHVQLKTMLLLLLLFFLGGVMHSVTFNFIKLIGNFIQVFYTFTDFLSFCFFYCWVRYIEIVDYNCEFVCFSLQFEFCFLYFDVPLLGA